MIDFEKTFDEERVFYKNRIETLCAKLEKNQMMGIMLVIKGKLWNLQKKLLGKIKWGGDWHR